MKKLVYVKGNSGAWHKMFLHKDTNNNHGWFITEGQYNRMSSCEPMGWSLDEGDLKAIGCKFIYMCPKKSWMSDCLIWEELDYDF